MLLGFNREKVYKSAIQTWFAAFHQIVENILFVFREFMLKSVCIMLRSYYPVIM